MNLNRVQNDNNCDLPSFRSRFYQRKYLMR